MGKWSSPPVRNNSFRSSGDAPPITVGSTTGGDSPSHHHRHKSNAPRTVGDAHFEPAVGGGGALANPFYGRVTQNIFPFYSKNLFKSLTIEE